MSIRLQRNLLVELVNLPPLFPLSPSDATEPLFKTFILFVISLFPVTFFTRRYKIYLKYYYSAIPNQIPEIFLSNPEPDSLLFSR
jgi:hypothetical protein